MRTREDVDEFFRVRLHQHNLLGRFGLTPRKAQMTGLNAGTLLVVTYQTECVFLMRSNSGIFRKKRDRDFHPYFQVQLETITPIEGRLHDYQRALSQAGLSDKELVKTRNWPSLPDELEAFTLDYFRASGSQIAKPARTPVITVDQLVAYAVTHKGESVRTIGNQTAFMVRPAGRGVEILPRGSSPRRVTHKALGRYLAIYNQTGSLVTTHYQDGFRHASYVLALIREVVAPEVPAPAEIGLTAKAQALLSVLVSMIRSGQVKEGDPTTFVPYSVALAALGLPTWPRAGRKLRTAGLDDLNEWTKSARVPTITGLIVSKSSWRPSSGFPRSHGRDPEGAWEDWWIRETNKAIRFDWSPYCGAENPPAVDVPTEGIPKRIVGEISRIVRDTAIVKELKRLYGGTCQRCGGTLPLPAGRLYSEGHHIKPLGGEHKGPDQRDNVLCLCPNCHVLLDFAAVEIDIDQLVVVRHSINPEFVAYHNKRLVHRSPRAAG